MSYLLIFCTAINIATWNGNWFPSGRAGHRANEEVEAATIRVSARILANGLKNLGLTNDFIIGINEIRSSEVASNLTEQLNLALSQPGCSNAALRVATVSKYRHRNNHIDYQQDAILTSLPVIASGWHSWNPIDDVYPGRGFAFAMLEIPTAEDSITTAIVYSVHLKSNYGSSTPAIAAANQTKRTIAVKQLIDLAPTNMPILIMGDFNADIWRKEFANEPLFPLLENAGFTNLWVGVKKTKRNTYPNKKHGNSTLDYFFLRDFNTLVAPFTRSSEEISDHRPAFSTIALP